MSIRLDEWFVRVKGDGFTPPEAMPPRLCGRIGQDEHRVVTSAIVRSEGRLVYTRSGSVYLLGRIDRSYRRWLRKQGIAYDPKDPIKKAGPCSSGG